MNAPLPVEVKQSIALAAMTEAELCSVLQSSLYPGAKLESIKLVIGYCKAAGLDPMQKPVHIVPMRVKKGGTKDEYEWRDVVMPGVGLYRTQAARTGQLAGISEPEFGPTKVLKWAVGEHRDEVRSFEYPEWCRVKVLRLLPNGRTAEFVAVERWTENYASKDKGIQPNAMWEKRPHGQLAKCAEAQALRRAFPEMTGSQATADELEGKTIEVDVTPEPVVVEGPKAKVAVGKLWSSETDTPEGGPSADSGQPAAKSDPSPESGTGEGEPKKDARPMAPGQVRILEAKMKQHALSETDFVARWGKPLAAENFLFTDFAAIQAWIQERGQ